MGVNTICPILAPWAIFQGVKLMAKYQIMHSVGLGAFQLVFLCLIILLWDKELKIVLFQYVLSSWLVLFLGIWMWVRQPFFQKTKKLSMPAGAWGSALPLFCMTCFDLTLWWCGQIFLGIWKSSNEVAIYSAAIRTAMLTTFVLTAINGVIAPKFAQIFKHGNHKELKRMSIWSTRIMLICCSPILIIFLIFPTHLLGLFGQEFTVGANAFIILTIGQFINVSTGSVGLLLNMTGKENLSLISTAAAAIAMIALCFFLIPKYGFLGASIAQASSLSIQMTLNTFFVKKELGFIPMNIFSKV